MQINNCKYFILQQHVKISKKYAVYKNVKQVRQQRNYQIPDFILQHHVKISSKICGLQNVKQLAKFYSGEIIREKYVMLFFASGCSIIFLDVTHTNWLM